MMVRIRRSLVGLAGASLVVAAATAQEPVEPAAVASVVHVEGEIDELTERALEQQVKRALEAKPRFLILSIDSPGGSYEASRTIAWSLDQLRDSHGVTTVAFVRAHALSGATMVAFGCELVAMTPGGQLGDVMPIGMIGGLEPVLAEKFISPVRKDLERLALQRGYPVDVAAAMVDPKVELHRVLSEDDRGRLRPQWLTSDTLAELPPGERSRIREDQVVCPAGELLVIDPDQAMDMGIARLHAPDMAALCEALAVEFSIAKVVPEEVETLLWTKVVRFVTWWPVKLLLFAIGAVALLASLAQPGLGAPEAVFALCFAAVFFGSYLLGLADWVELVLLLVGLGLLATEVFITPGFGVTGALGIFAVGAALLLSFQRFVIPSNPVEWELMGQNLAKTVAGGAIAMVGMGLAIRFLPKSRLFGGLIHQHTLEETPLETKAHIQAPVGILGVATTQLRPVGKVQVEETVLDARSQEGIIERGATVVVVGHQGTELVVSARPEAVEQAKTKAATEPAGEGPGEAEQASEEPSEESTS